MSFVFVQNSFKIETKSWMKVCNKSNVCVLCLWKVLLGLKHIHECNIHETWMQQD